MRAMLALVRANWLTASSYRIEMILSLVGVLAAIVPVYLVSRALQPIMAASIRNEGHQYFGFLLVGTVTFAFLPLTIQSLPSLIKGSISNGTLEAVLGTPTPVPVLLAGMMGYSFLWTAARGLLVLLGGTLLGAAIQWSQVPSAVLIIGLIVAAHTAIGLTAAAAMLAFRTAGPLPQLAIVASTLLGGVYYPTHVIPSWIETLSAIFPLTYGLRALRRVLLDGMSLPDVSSDIAMLAGMAILMLTASTLLFGRALAYARRTGALSMY